MTSTLHSAWFRRLRCCRPLLLMLETCAAASVLLQGPEGTPYQGGVFELAISVPEQVSAAAAAARGAAAVEPGLAALLTSAVCPPKEPGWRWTWQLKQE